jgi:lipopolysaccharide export system protein LptA
MNRRLIDNGIALLLAVLAPTAWGLSTDTDQPMVIEADSAELDDRSGISTYKGNVRIEQGSMTLTGDRLTVHIEDDRVTRVIVDGSPATYKQRPDGKDRDIRAESRHMEYFTDPEKVLLEEQARVEQDGDTLSGERIVYDVATDQVSADGGSKPDQRVRITLQPKKKKKQNDQ